MKNSNRLLLGVVSAAVVFIVWSVGTRTVTAQTEDPCPTVIELGSGTATQNSSECTTATPRPATCNITIGSDAATKATAAALENAKILGNPACALIDPACPQADGPIIAETLNAPGCLILVNGTCTFFLNKKFTLQCRPGHQ